MKYRIQYLVPITVEIEASTDNSVKAIADELPLKRIMRDGEAQYPDLGYHAIIDETGRTVDET